MPAFTQAELHEISEHCAKQQEAADFARRKNPDLLAGLHPAFAQAFAPLVALQPDVQPVINEGETA